MSLKSIVKKTIPYFLSLYMIVNANANTTMILKFPEYVSFSESSISPLISILEEDCTSDVCVKNNVVLDKNNKTITFRLEDKTYYLFIDGSFEGKLYYKKENVYREEKFPESFKAILEVYKNLK